MASLETLSAQGTELTVGQLDDVDGGLVPIIIGGLIIIDVIIWKKVIDNW